MTVQVKEELVRLNVKESRRSSKRKEAVRLNPNVNVNLDQVHGASSRISSPAAHGQKHEKVAIPHIDEAKKAKTRIQSSGASVVVHFIKVAWRGYQLRRQLGLQDEAVLASIGRGK